ncbi:MAG: lipoyl synthase [bacterium]|nr:lipoyl synthase [bacterium]
MQRKPEWLFKKKDIRLNRDMKKMLRDLNLHTVCESAKCPNISECFKSNTATFMVLGDACTRYCKFCGVDKKIPAVPDINEGENIKKAVIKLGLKYVVITMVTRDDLSDGGGAHLAEIVKALKNDNQNILVELLTSDFYSSENYENLLKFIVNKLLNSGVDVFGHNIETCRRLYPEIRKISDYDRSLFVLKMIKALGGIAKTGIMLGLGETEEDIHLTLADIYHTGCDILTIGQYLMPSKKHYPLKRYVKEEEFETWRKVALGLGFRAVEAGPFVRSSYKAREIYNCLD